MITAADNDLLTRVTGDAPMARLMRENYWIPFARSDGLKAGEPPQRVRLFGEDFVAFRGSDGRPGLLDEKCPHRRCSLLLARVEDDSLRCIYHGWRMDVTGAVVEVPSEGANSAAFAARVKVSRYPARDGGGLVWAFLGPGEAPALPPFAFMDAPPERRWFSRTIVNCNWLQGFEGALDSEHVTWLHRGFGAQQSQSMGIIGPPTYEIETTDYGFRAAAIRRPEPGMTHFRVSGFVAPFYALSAGRQPNLPHECAIFIAVPIDDASHLLFYGVWDEAGPLASLSDLFGDGLDLDNLARTGVGPSDHWGQDRRIMASGHFSGFTDSVLQEDFSVQMSMGRVAERSLEHVCAVDVAVMQTRRWLLDLVKRRQAGEAIDGGLRRYGAKRHLPFSYMAPDGADWRGVTGPVAVR